MRPIRLLPWFLLASIPSAALATPPESPAGIVRLHADELGVDPEFTGAAPTVLVSPTPVDPEAFAREKTVLEELHAGRIEALTQAAAKERWTVQARRDALAALKLQHEIETLRLRARHAAALGHEELAAGLSALADRMTSTSERTAEQEVAQ